MLKTLFAVFFGLFVFDAALAQKKDTAIYYLTNAGKEVANKADADLVLMVLPPDPEVDKKLYVVKGYYPNGSMRLLGSSKTPAMPLTLQGAFFDFFPGGHKRKMQTFENGEPIGNIVEYYPNGKVYTVKSYEKNGGAFLQQCRDSTGVILADNGKGTWKDFNGDFTIPASEGEVDKGIAQGIWLQRISDSVTVKNTYNKGTLLASQRVYKYNSDSTIYFNADTPAKFKGGINGFNHFIGRNIHYPLLAREQNTQGKVVVGFVIEKDGHISNAKLVKGIGGGCDEEAMRVLMSSPPWTPASIKNRPVRLSYSVPISFYLSTDGSIGDIKPGQTEKNADDGSTKIFSAVERAPEFPGGLEAFYKFLAKNVRYPDAARTNNTSGRVVVQFVVERDGSLTDMKVVRSLSNGCDEEALRVMKLSPNWLPGVQNGRPVRVMYSIPVNFTLTN